MYPLKTKYLALDTSSITTHLTVWQLTMIGWLACGVGKAASSSSSVSGGGGLGGVALSLGSGGRGGAPPSTQNKQQINVTVDVTDIYWIANRSSFRNSKTYHTTVDNIDFSN